MMRGIPKEEKMLWGIKIKNLKVGVGDKEILKGVNLNFELGKNYCLLGKNGSGKSTLSSFLMGHPKYEYISGSVEITSPQPSPQGEGVEQVNLLDLNPEQRSQAGLFLSFQNVPEIQGIRLGEYLRIIYNISKTSDQKPPLTPPYKGGGQEQKSEFRGLSPFLFKRFIKKYLEELHIDEMFLSRELNVGFSGGEKRKIEILQMKLIGPKYIILDEVDSGLDLDAFKTIAEMLKKLSNKNNTLIIITHYFKILEYIDVDKVYVMKEGMIVKEGGMNLAKKISESGFVGI